ncbi:MAG: DUF6089 family protein [Bacteroidota bacterium]
MKKLHFILLLCCCTLTSFAQRGWELGGTVGVAYYFGDLNTTFDLGSPGLMAGLAARYNFNNRLCLKMSANYLTISADDANSSNSFERARNLNFQSNIIDGTFQFEFNFLPYNHGSRDEFFTPYLFSGFSVYHFDPKTELNGETYQLRTFGTEGQFRGEEYYSIGGALTFGGGIKFDLSYRWSINIELSSRKLFTDFIDDVSGTYPDMDDLEALRGPIAVALSDRSMTADGVRIGGEGRQRGNGRSNDNFSTLGVSLLYYFGSLPCPW